MVLNDAVRQALTLGHLAHLVTLNADGRPQVTLVWVGLDGDEIVRPVKLQATRACFKRQACQPQHQTGSEGPG